MKQLLIIHLSIILMMSCIAVSAQSPCANTLYEANKSYEAGDFTKSVALLKPCLNSGFSRDEKFEGYRLLALNYIYLNQLQQADTAVKKMLEKNNSYKLFPYIDDPAGLSRIIANYNVVPVLSVGIYSGFNFANINLLENHTAGVTTASYQPLLGFQAGVEAEYNVWKGLSVSAGFQITDCRYTHVIDSLVGLKQEFTEDLTYIQIPIIARYNFLKNEAVWRPYLEAGFAFDHVAGDVAHLLATNLSNGTVKRSSFDPTSRRTQNLTSIALGAGVQYRVFTGNLKASVRYLIGLTNVVNSDNRYNDMSSVFLNQYIDDAFKFDRWQFSLGYSFPVFYNVVKITK